MMQGWKPNNFGSGNRRGIVLLVTLVLLVVLATVAFTLSSRVAEQRYRNQYIVDYQIARYSCDSAAKYALAVLEDINSPQLISRPNEPDFSDLFTLTEAEYENLLAGLVGANTVVSDSNENTGDISDVNDINDFNNISDINNPGDVNDSNKPAIVRGPYGPAWPFITEPVEFEIGSAKVRIEIEDENAKYPIGWALLSGEDVQRQALAGFETFCEWMDVDSASIELLKRQLGEIGEVKTFKMDFEPVTTTVKRAPLTKEERIKRRKGPSRIKPIEKTLPTSVHTANFAGLFHSSLIDTEPLARPTIIGESRKESALKYMGMWASNQVNINTAPRQVLESAFAFGGDAAKIAEEIIQARRIKPFESIEELRKSLLRHSDSIEKCEKYITTTSNFFTIRVTAASGVAEASTVMAIMKNNEKTERIAMISN